MAIVRVRVSGANPHKPEGPYALTRDFGHVPTAREPTTPIEAVVARQVHVLKPALQNVSSPNNAKSVCVLVMPGPCQARRRAARAKSNSRTQAWGSAPTIVQGAEERSPAALRRG